MAKKGTSRDEFRKKVVPTFKSEPYCEGAMEFEITRHEPNKLGVNWAVKLLSPCPDDKCYTAARTVIAPLPTDSADSAFRLF